MMCEVGNFYKMTILTPNLCLLVCMHRESNAVSKMKFIELDMFYSSIESERGLIDLVNNTPQYISVIGPYHKYPSYCQKSVLLACMRQFQIQNVYNCIYSTDKLKLKGL